MKLNSITLGLLLVTLLFGGIGFTSAMNWWQTESTKEPARYTEGEAAGQYNPADIRGSYTFGDINRAFEVPLADLQIAFRVPAGVDLASYPVKSLEEQFADLPVEMGTASVRMFVAFYKGLPYTVSADEETYLLPEAAEVLKARGSLLPEQAAYLETHIVVEDAPQPAPTSQPEQPAAGAATPAPTEHAAPERTVTGKTTFQDLLDWGVTQESIEGILGSSMPAPGTAIKDYLSLKGLEFSTLKGQFQAEVDQIK